MHQPGQGQGGATPHLKRTMFFIDGTNFISRMSETWGIVMDAQRPPMTTFTVARNIFDVVAGRMGPGTVIYRRYWVGSYRGGDGERDKIADELFRMNFMPVLLQAGQGREKGVDMTLAIHLLVNAFQRNFDVGWLIAGDADYVQLVQEAKRYGCIINVAAWESGLAPSLKRAADEFHDLTAFTEGTFLNTRFDMKALYDAFETDARNLEPAAKQARKRRGRSN